MIDNTSDSDAALIRSARVCQPCPPGSANHESPCARHGLILLQLSAIGEQKTLIHPLMTIYGGIP